MLWHEFVALLLLLLMLPLAALIPGSPLEKRETYDFPMHHLVFFSALSTMLGFGGILLIFPSYNAELWALVVASLVGIVHATLYVLGLSNRFPHFTEQMPLPLKIIELLGLIWAILLTVSAVLAILSY